MASRRKWTLGRASAARERVELVSLHKALQARHAPKIAAAIKRAWLAAADDAIAGRDISPRAFEGIAGPIIAAASASAIAAQRRTIGIHSQRAAGPKRVAKATAAEWARRYWTPLDAFARRARDWAAREVGGKVSQIAARLLADLRQIVARSIESGEGVDVAIRQIRAAGIRRSAYEAQRIAVTETHSAMTWAAAEEAAAQTARLGIVMVRRWVASEDHRTRPAHALADGQRRKAGEPYSVGGELIMRPGTGSARNAINCRCVEVFEEDVAATDALIRARKSFLDCGQVLGCGMRLEILKASDDGFIAGLASPFGERDKQGDVVLPGAYRSLRPGATLPMLLEHDPTRTVGVWTKAESTPEGLAVEGKMFLELAAARDALRLVKAGDLTGLSIAGDGVSDGLRRISAVDLREISLVKSPAADGARIRIVKTVINWDAAAAAYKEGRNGR